MKRYIVFLLAAMLLASCASLSKVGKNTQTQMRALYGENKTLSSLPAGSPVLVAHNGQFVGKRQDGVCIFKGIPYAQPPVGKNRWKEPRQANESSEIREAYYYGKSGIQTLAESERASFYPQGEDCLTLNIWAAGDSLTDKPVMVWIHGGSYGWGGTSDPLYDGLNFIKAHPDVVLVTINYRIGIMGFLDLSNFEGGEDYPSSANLGLLDQVEALRWIQRNIGSVGGDAANVTLFGESAGGGSVSLLPLVKEAKGLFRRVIAQSGSVALSSSKEECKLLAKRLQRLAKTHSVSDLLALSEKELMSLNEKLNDYNCFPMRDGNVLPLDPYTAYARGEAKDIDFFIGTNADEVRYWIGELGGETVYRLGLPIWYDNIIATLPKDEQKEVKQFVKQRNDKRIWNITEFLNELMFRAPALQMAQTQVEAGGKAFVYYWEQPSALKNRGACHAVELAYVFNNLDEHLYTGDNINENLAHECQEMWVNFAKTGNPSTANHIVPQYDTATRATIVLDSLIHVKNDPLAEQRQLVVPLLSHYISPLYSNISFNVPTVWKYGVCVAVPVLLITGVVIWMLL